MNEKRIKEIRARCESAKEVGFTGFNLGLAVYESYCSEVPELLEYIEQLQAENKELKIKLRKRKLIINSQAKNLRKVRAKLAGYKDGEPHNNKELALHNVINFKNDEIDKLKREIEQMRKLYMKLLVSIEKEGDK